MEVKGVGVVGAGQVGASIAAVLLMYGHPVVLRSRFEPTLQKARAGIEDSLARRIAKGGLTPAQKEKALKRLKTTPNLSDFKDVDLVVEVVAEDIDVKKNVFAELDAICSAKTILTTTSSSIPITTLAAATKRPERCVKMHFWYPATALTYLELARGYLTSDETWETVKALAKQLGRQPIRIVKDYHGSSNAYLQHMPPTGESPGSICWELMFGKTTLEKIETRPKGGKTPEGFEPVFNIMETLDFVGLDTILGYLEAEAREYGQSNIPPLLRRMVEAGHLGQQSGIGFYDYAESPRKAIMGRFSPYLVKFLAPDEELVT
ncbi:MAG: 3-hydroxyacyl-CoA dehydrogenase family protein [Chloroflexi bacterium]|nr:3-hydroxyacyl-CoA dehydrogenase family protein [Chloroflexota bacterium]